MSARRVIFGAPIACLLAAAGCAAFSGSGGSSGDDQKSNVDSDAALGDGAVGAGTDGSGAGSESGAGGEGGAGGVDAGVSSLDGTVNTTFCTVPGVIFCANFDEGNPVEHGWNSAIGNVTLATGIARSAPHSAYALAIMNTTSTSTLTYSQLSLQVKSFVEVEFAIRVDSTPVTSDTWAAVEVTTGNHTIRFGWRGNSGWVFSQDNALNAGSYTVTAGQWYAGSITVTQAGVVSCVFDNTAPQTFTINAPVSLNLTMGVDATTSAQTRGLHFDDVRVTAQ